MKKMSYLLILILGACVSLKPSFTNIELSIYPASGGEIGYNIIIQNDTIKTEVRELAIAKDNIVLGKSKNELQKKISKNQTDSINHYYVLLSFTKQDIDSSFVLDTWIYVLKVNSKEIARFNSSSIANQKDELRRLVSYIIRLSPIKLNLIGFS
jgi:hypothetical protein